MENIYILLFVFLICWYFSYLRKVSEFARKHASNYCEQTSLQFITIARKFSRPKFDKEHGLYFLSVFEFEFSGDGESSSTGELSLRGIRLDQVNLPAYKI